MAGLPSEDMTERDSSVEGAQAASRDGSKGGTTPFAGALSEVPLKPTMLLSLKSHSMWLYLLTLFSSHLHAINTITSCINH